MPLRGGAAKARRAMRKRYGKKRGTAIFWKTVNKRGKKGQSRDAKARSVFKRKRKRGRRKRR